jgi:hypothetical protein
MKLPDARYLGIFLLNLLHLLLALFFTAVIARRNPDGAEENST